jgi:hypothetical protein
MQRRQVLGLAAVSLVLTACRKKSYYAPTAELEYGVHVRIGQVYLRRKKLVVTAYVTNGGNQPMRIDRGQWAVRLPSGAVVQANASRSSVFDIPPGRSREIEAHFEAQHGEFDRLVHASVIVGGVMVGSDPTPYVVGEVPISQEPINVYGEEPPGPGGPGEPPPVAPAEPPPGDAPPVDEAPPGPGHAVPPPGEVTAPPPQAPPSVVPPSR